MPLHRLSAKGRCGEGDDAPCRVSLRRRLEGNLCDNVFPAAGIRPSACTVGCENRRALRNGRGNRFLGQGALCNSCAGWDLPGLFRSEAGGACKGKSTRLYRQIPDSSGNLEAGKSGCHPVIYRLQQFLRRADKPGTGNSGGSQRPLQPCL